MGPSCVCFLLLLLSVSVAETIAPSPLPHVFNVEAFGAVPDRKTDSAKVFIHFNSPGESTLFTPPYIFLSFKHSHSPSKSAFNMCLAGFPGRLGSACAWKGRSRMLIPRGTFLVKAVTFGGPCRGSVEVRVRGTVLAPANIGVDYWIDFSYVDGLHVTGRGPGAFDGQGASAWAANDCNRTLNCRKLPRSLGFNFVNNSAIHGISSIDSKSFHIQIFASQNINLTAITITAPEDSPNTDGIHIGSSTNIRISRSNISTGDDCISIGSGSRNVHISNVTCGPGHGISVGSLGALPNEMDVLGITVRNCSFSGTENGVRIKTWQSSHPLLAHNITFEDVVMHDVKNPIIIDQTYCPNGLCHRKFPPRVRISDVEFRNIRGTSASKVAINLSCSELVPCIGVELNGIDLIYDKKGETAVSSCSNVKGRAIGRVIPPSCI